MRRALAGLAVLALVAALGVAGLLALRARLAESATLRATLRAAADAQLGVRLEPGPLGVELWSEAVVLPRPALELPDGGRLELSGLRLEIDRRDLLDGIARVRSAVLEGPARLQSPHLVLDGVLRLSLAPAPAGGGWALDGRLVLDSGGAIGIAGRMGEGGVFTGELQLEAVDAGPFVGLLTAGRDEPEATLAGRFDGRLESEGGAAPATLRVASSDARIRVPPVALTGPVALVARLPAEAGRERFAVDATRARVEYAGGVARGTADGASVEGWLVRDDEGRLRAEEVSLRLERFRGRRGAAEEEP